MVLNNNFNVYVGSSTGSIKGVTVGNDGIDTSAVFKNCVKNKENISNKNEITCMNWCNKLENEILIGMKDRIKIFQSELSDFSEELNLHASDTCGVFKENETIFVAVTSGIIKSWKFPYKDDTSKEEMKLNNEIERMKQSILKPNVIATGGNENDVKLWDLNRHELIFAAKNIKPDELQLRIPVWVSDITFFDNNERIACCTRHGYIRLYDPLLPQRRPIFNAYHSEQVFTSIADTKNDYNLLVGSGTGDLILVDIRGKCSLAGKYKGFCGAVKSIACPKNQSIVLSVSLDRHFRIHDFTSRKLLFKEYMQSRLTTLLPKTDFVLEKFEIKDVEEKEPLRPGIPFKQKRKMKTSLDDAKYLDKIFNKLGKTDDM